ncbi:MAG TPA: potassium-transporting ATPase subunit C [Acidimicrobiales bacterium]|nr:potassium-transporting ATPase subunit C [Acidimicrobiales bacterium]
MIRRLPQSLVVLLALTLVLGFAYPLLVTGLANLFFRHQAEGSLVYQGGRLVGSTLLGQDFTDAHGNPLAQYFQPRPSAAGPSGYDGASSSASNLGPTNPLLVGFVPGVNTPPWPNGTPGRTNPFATPEDPNCVPLSTAGGGTPVYENLSGLKLERRDGVYVCDPNTVPERAIAYRKFNQLPQDATVPVDAVTASGSGLDPDISVANAMDQAPRVARARGLPLATVVGLVDRHIEGRQLGFLGEPVVDVLLLNQALDRLR